ncbi:MAG: hypothetical protein JOY69_05140, partial [Candidatus Eremiobacteraeota bacterium]|nr:hypothetical protein [Candidatus Eremiobacteraeota bacterium]
MWRIFGGACIVFAVALTAYAVSDASEIGIGINYNWWAFTRMSLHDCRAQDQPRTVPQWILPAYDRVPVRHAVREQLTKMRRAGFASLRIIVFYGHDTRPDPSAFTSLTGDVKPADRMKLANFVGDIARAGFRSLEVVPDFGAENALFCRNRQWGDCFDPRRIGENWRFIAQVSQTAIAAAGRMRVRVDIANEKAPDPAMPAATLQRAKTYLQTIAGRFQRRFGARWLVSVARSGHSDPVETSNRLNLLAADLAEARLVPKFLELHEYSDDPQDVQESLDA